MSDHSGWRAVAAAWMVAVALTGALALVQREAKAGSTASLRSLAAAARLAHLNAADPECPTSDETCSDRDYANERC
jgi:hypothetical protein